MDIKTQQEVDQLNLNVGYFSEILDTFSSTIKCLDSLEEGIVAEKDSLLEKLRIAQMQIAEVQAMNASNLVAALKN